MRIIPDHANTRHRRRRLHRIELRPLVGTRASRRHLVVYDLLTYAGNRARLGRGSARVRAGRHRRCQPRVEDPARLSRSTPSSTSPPSRTTACTLRIPRVFFRTNVARYPGDCARRRVGVGVERFHHISTCEVYGDLALDTRRVVQRVIAVSPPHALQRLQSRRRSRRACLLETSGCRSRSRTAPTTTGRISSRRRSSRCFTTRALDDQPLPLYASTQNRRREWIHVDDHCRAIDLVLDNGRGRRDYHVGTGAEAQHRARSPTTCARRAGQARVAQGRSSPTAPATTGATCSTLQDRKPSSAGSRW